MKMRRMRPTPVYRLPLLALSSLLLFATVESDLAAQEPSMDEGGIKLTLKEVPDIESGKASILTGTTGPEGDKFFVEHLTMFQPVMVVLMAADPLEPLRLNLAKYRFDETVWSEQTGSEGAVAHQFRTQGELKIHVEPVNAEPGSSTGYHLITWAADLPEPDLPPPVEVIEGSGGGGGLPGWLKIGGGALMLIVIAAVFFRLGRKS